MGLPCIGRQISERNRLCYIVKNSFHFYQVGLNLSFRLIWNVGCDRDHRAIIGRRGFDGHKVHGIINSTRAIKIHLSE